MSLFLTTDHTIKKKFSKKSGFHPNDYLFLINNKKLLLYYVTEEYLLKKIRFTPQITPRELPFLPWIKLTRELILFVGGKRGKKSLIQLHTTKHLNTETLTAQKSYQTLRQFHIVDQCDPDSINLQLFYCNQQLQLHPAPFVDQKLINLFQDPLYLQGQGQPNKDQLITHFQNQKIITEKTCSMIQFYNLFCTPYRVDPTIEQAVTTLTGDQSILELNNHPLNTIYHGAPGTGKTYQAISDALELIFGKVTHRTGQFTLAKNRGELEMITLHQNYSYEEFIQGIRAETIEKKINYSIKDGVFLKLAKRAIENDKAPRSTTPLRPFICIIDELNRGNIAAIFGELITLLEPTKRLNGSDQISITLPYSKEAITLPPNLYLIATMNSDDHTTIPLDHAIRRRFHFIDLKPDYSLLNIDLYGINLQKMVAVLNQRISYLLGERYILGHTYFMEVDTVEALKTLFLQQIIPQLRTHCGGDDNRVNLLLNNNGFLKMINPPEKLFFRHINTSPLFEINLEALDQIDGYRGIYE